MKYHIEYAKYKYGYVTVVGWLIGDTAEADTGLQVLDRERKPMAAEVTRTVREDIRETFFPGGTENRYGFRVRLQCRADEKPVLVLRADGRRAVCPMNPRMIDRTGMIPDDWKQQFKQILWQRTGKNLFHLQRDTDGAVIVENGTDNPYARALLPGGESAGEESTAGTGQLAGDESAEGPLFSILVPLYRTNREHLLDLLTSVQHQSYADWELCLADGSPEPILPGGGSEAAGTAKMAEMTGTAGTSDPVEAADPIEAAKDPIEGKIAQFLRDPRVKYRHLEQNLGISGNTNAALEMARGTYAVMADHDDLLSPDALLIAAEQLACRPETDFLYSDSDLTDHDHLYNYNPLYKPGWSPEMLYSANYITHLSIVRTDLLRRLGGFRAAYDGAQDWDLFLRIGEETDRIRHIPEILYHWRAAAGSTASSVEEKPYARAAQLKSVQDHLDRLGIPARAAFADSRSTCIRVGFTAAGTVPVRIVTAPGIRLSPEQEQELRSWAGVPGIGIVGVRVLDGTGRIRSQGRLLQTGGGSVALYAGREPGTADALGHTDWYRNDLIPDPACYAVPASVAAEIGMPEVSGGEAAMAEWFLDMKRAGYRSLITPFVEVTVDG